MNELHVTPENDLIEHADDEECVCGPDVTFIEGGKRVTHHSLDGREGSTSTMPERSVHWDVLEPMAEGDRVRTPRGAGTVVSVIGETFPAAIWVELDDVRDPQLNREWFNEGWEVTKL